MLEIAAISNHSFNLNTYRTFRKKCQVKKPRSRIGKNDIFWDPSSRNNNYGNEDKHRHFVVRLRRLVQAPCSPTRTFLFSPNKRIIIIKSTGPKWKYTYMPFSIIIYIKNRQEHFVLSLEQLSPFRNVTIIFVFHKMGSFAGISASESSYF